MVWLSTPSHLQEVNRHNFTFNTVCCQYFNLNSRILTKLWYLHVIQRNFLNILFWWINHFSKTLYGDKQELDIPFIIHCSKVILIGQIILKNNYFYKVFKPLIVLRFQDLLEIDDNLSNLFTQCNVG